MDCSYCKFSKSREIFKIRDEYMTEVFCGNSTVVKKFTDMQKELAKEIPALEPFLAAIYVPKPALSGCKYFERREGKINE